MAVWTIFALHLWRFYIKRKTAKKDSVEPELNQWPKDNLFVIESTVLRSTSWAIDGIIHQEIFVFYTTILAFTLYSDGPLGFQNRKRKDGKVEFRSPAKT